MTMQIGLPARGTYTLAASAANLAALLGYVDDEASGKSWRLVKAKTAITDGSGKAVNFTITGGVISWKVALTSTLKSLVVAGIIDPNLATTVDLPLSSYFWVQRKGDCLAWCASTVTGVTNMLVTITTTAGYLGKGTYAGAAATAFVGDQSATLGHPIGVFATAAARVNVRLENIY
jgi:hypothetical protein